MILSDEDLNFSFDEIQKELANLGITSLNNQQLIRLKNDLDLLINKEKYLLRHLKQQPSQSLTKNPAQQQIYNNHHATTDNSKKIVSYPSKPPVSSSSPSSPSRSPSSSSSCFSVTHEDFSNSNTNSNDCISVNHHTKLNDPREKVIQGKSSILNNHSLNLDQKNISDASSLSNAIQLSPKYHHEYDQKPYSSTDSQITVCFSTTNEAMNNLDTASISSSLSSTTLLQNEAENHFEEKQQQKLNHYHHHQRQQQKHTVQSGNELTSSKQSVNFEYNDANGQPIHSKSSMKNFQKSLDIAHDLNNDFILPPMKTITSSSTDKNYCHLKSISKDSSNQLGRSSAYLYLQHQQPRYSHQHLHYDQESRDKLHGKCEPIVEKINTHTTTNRDPHDYRNNNLSTSNNNKLEKTLRCNKINDVLHSVDYQRQNCTTNTTTTATNSSRRSARFLDNPVEQVHSVPQQQQQRPKSAQHCQKGNDCCCYNSRSLHSQRPVSTSTYRQKEDPVAKYHSYQRSWSIHSTPGENARRVLRWNIRTAMMHREIPLLQRNSAEVIRLLGPYASVYLEQERQRRIKALKLDYIPPTNRRYNELRQIIRSLMG